MKKLWCYKNAQIGDVVYIKKNPEGVVGLAQKIGTVIQKFSSDSGVTVEFPSPINITYEKGFGIQTVKTFTLKTSNLKYASDVNPDTDRMGLS